jgi:hypothetical protein
LRFISAIWTLFCMNMHRGALCDPQPDGRDGVRLGGEHLRQRATAALAHGDDNLALARLVFRQPPISCQDDQASQELESRACGTLRYSHAIVHGLVLTLA